MALSLNVSCRRAQPPDEPLVSWHAEWIGFAEPRGLQIYRRRMSASRPCAAASTISKTCSKPVGPP
jgi:hypothetical protein